MLMHLIVYSLLVYFKMNTNQRFILSVFSINITQTDSLLGSKFGDASSMKNEILRWAY